MIWLRLAGSQLHRGYPSLYPSSDLIEKTRVAYGLDSKTIGDRLLIGINPGPNWRVKEWEPSKWQKLINRIHSEYACGNHTVRYDNRRRIV